jgi:GR25 family glycosyltransferase involved in LPS biosynthesis
VHVIDAVDGLQLDGETIRRVTTRRLHRPRYPFALSPAETARFLSHRKAWQAIMDEGLDAGLIIEDDAAVASQDFDAVLAATLAGLGQNEFVRLPHRDRYEDGPVVRSHGPATLMEPQLPALGMVMQVVARGAAQRLLDASVVFDRPVDSFVQMHWIHQARVLTARPIVVREICSELGGSVIHPVRAGIAHKLGREIRRPLIRLAIRRESQRRRRAA